MEINIEKELQTLKSEYNVFKEGLEKQETLNEKFSNPSGNGRRWPSTRKSEIECWAMF